MSRLFHPTLRRPLHQVAVLLALSLAASLAAQTVPETEAYRKAQRDRETARRMIREGTAQAALRDIEGMDGTIDNAAKREAGKVKADEGAVLLAAAEEVIRTYEIKRETLRLLMQNRDRTLELESRDGRKATFGILEVELPRLTVVRPDLTVFDLSHDALSDASKAAVLAFLEPKMDIVATPAHGGHVFPSLLLALPRPGGQENENSLPAFGVDFRISPTAANLSKSTTFEVTAESSMPGMRLQTRRFDLELVPAAVATQPADGGTQPAPSQPEPGPVVLSPRITLDLNLEELRRVVSPAEAVLRLELAYGENSARELSLPLTLHGGAEIPLAIAEADGRILDTSRLLAACVDESLAEFDALKTFGKDEGILNEAGESATGSDTNEARLFTLWHHLATQGFKVTASAAGEDTLAKGYIARRIQLPAQVMATRQLDTFEAALLFASYALKENLVPLVVFKADQAIVALRVGEQDFLLLDPAGLPAIKFAENAGKAEKLQASREAFDRASGTARRAHLRMLARAENSGAPRARHPEGATLQSLATTFQVVDIKKARDAGVSKLVRPVEPPPAEKPPEQPAEKAGEKPAEAAAPAAEESPKPATDVKAPEEKPAPAPEPKPAEPAADAPSPKPGA